MADKPKMWPTSETRLFMPRVTEEDKAALTTERGRQAAKMPHDEAKEYVKASADVDKDYDATAQATSIKGNQLQAKQVLGSMKKGGKIPKTGLYKLHKDEQVIPAEKAKQMAKMDKATEGLAVPAKAKRSKKSIHLTIEPTDNKGFIVKHTEHQDGMPGKTKHHVFANASDMHKHVMKTYPAKATPVAEAAEPTGTSEAAEAESPAVEAAEAQAGEKA